MKKIKNMKIVFIILLTSLVALILFQNTVSYDPSIPGITVIPTKGMNFYRVKVLKSVSSSGTSYLIAGGDYNGQVAVYGQDANGDWQKVWSKWPGGFIYALAAVDINNDQTEDLLVGSANKKLTAFDGKTGNLIKSYEFQSPVWAIGASKRNFRNGTFGIRIVAGTAGGELKLFGRNLEVLDDYYFGREGNFNDNGVIRDILVGNFSSMISGSTNTANLAATPYEDFLVIRMKKSIFITQNIFQIAGDQRDQLMRTKEICLGANLPAPKIRAMNGFNGYAGPLRGDDKIQVVSQYGINSPVDDPDAADTCDEGADVEDVNGTTIISGSEIGPNLTPLDGSDWFPFYGNKYRMEMPVIGNFHTADGQEVFTLHGQDMYLNDSLGKVVSNSFVRGKYGFTDVDVLPGQNGNLDSVVLGSMPNGDENLYLINFDDSYVWHDSVTQLSLNGKLADIDNNLALISKQVNNWTPTTSGRGEVFNTVRGLRIDAYGDSKYLAFSALNINGKFDTIRHLAYTEERSPDSPYKMDERHADAPSPRPDIFKNIKNKITEFPALANYALTAGHGPSFDLLPETFDYLTGKVPDATDTILLNESLRTEHYATMRNRLTSVEHSEGSFSNYTVFASEVMSKFLPTAARPNKAVLVATLAKNGAWAIGATPDEFNAYLGSLVYKPIIVPSGEDSTGPLLEMSYAARLGLWVAGYVDHWGFKMAGDQFNVNRYWDWEYPLHGHPHLRHLINNVTKGADYLTVMYEEATTAHTEYDRVAKLFLSMINKGIIAVPNREQLKSVSSIAVTYIPSSSDAFANVRNFNSDTLTLDQNSGELFSRIEHRWAMAPLKENNALARLFNSKRRGLNYLPSGDHGHVTWFQHVPASTLLGKGFEEVWQTDGYTITRHLRDGSQTIHTGWDETLNNALLAASDRLDIQVRGEIVSNVIKQNDNHYQVILIDPRYLDPKDSMVKLQLSSNLGEGWVVQDRLSGSIKSKPDDQAHYDIQVKAGLFKILDVYRN